MGQQTEAEKKIQENRFVLNASVSLLWFLIDEPPELRLRARWLLDDIMSGRVIIHVPDIWLFEVSGGLVKAVHAKRLNQIQAQEALSRVEGLLALPNWNLHSHDKGWFYSDVARWAMGFSVSFYDAVYLHLATQTKAAFWTADKRLYEFLVRARVSKVLKAFWIGDYKPMRSFSG
ncbi:MAG: type II toxin-antitoxin system VapC family toxin [Armatimonadetes bacterium]|nr:type II toxin-antitoxin system VapC family toxin [Armatimonadota bacterium]MDW8029597.1 type II toxin-antitoxin system VapC family toxin [Armatimonadota bacterium]